MKKFRSFFNDENAVKKVLLFITPFLLALLILAGIQLGSYLKSIEPAPKPVQDEITHQAEKDEPTAKEEETYAETEPEELRVDFFGDFVPFESKGTYCDFSNINSVENRDGVVFRVSGNSIVYTLNGQDKTLFSIDNPNVHIRVNAFIDDALYFIISANDIDIDGSYRVWLSYNETGEVSDGGVSFRFNKHLEPIKAENNTIIFSSLSGDYISFDTQTGEFTPIDYNRELEYGELADKLPIDMEKAVDIAEKELKNNKYYIAIHGEEYDHDHGMKPTGNNTLLYRPNYVYSVYQEEFKFDLYPEYAWRINFKGEFWGVVYVNAETGEVTFVSLDYLD